jgi:hypothetical protein
LCFVSKIAVKAAIQQLNDYFTANNLNFDHQSSYKQNFSTETTLCALVNDLLWDMEKSQATILVSLDLSAACDTVDHVILASILNINFGINGNAVAWFRSYLTDRKLQVKVGDVSSPVHTFNYSVPQGSCLGPVLFNAYVSTITECIHDDLSIGGYADVHYVKGNFDPKDFNSTTDCIKMIEGTLDSIQHWMSANRLKMNPSKTEVIIFGTHTTISKTTINKIDVAGDDIIVSNHIKYLGALLDNTLNFEEPNARPSPST